MAQFDVYENINEKTKEQIPFLLDIQNDILKNLSSRIEKDKLNGYENLDILEKLK